jgi:hypothetical protein
VSSQNQQNQNNMFLAGLVTSMGGAGGAVGIDTLANIRAIPDELAEKIRAARVEARHKYIDGYITREQYEAQNNLINELVAIQLRWYKAYIKNFDDLSFVGACGDGSAVF